MIKKVSKQEFLEEAQPTKFEALERALSLYPDALGIVLFRNMMMDSSSLGESSCVIVGPSNTFKSVEDCEGKWLKDLPSQRQYPQVWVSKDDLLQSASESEPAEPTPSPSGGFKLGAMVTWSSQAGGRTTTKVGEIVAVVPPGKKPKDVAGAGSSRDHESYVVKARDSRGHDKRYWPLVKYLSSVTAPNGKFDPDVALRNHMTGSADSLLSHAE